MARVLITDDAAFMRMMIKNILTQNGHEVVGEAENGNQAVEQFTELTPDVARWTSPCRRRTASPPSRASSRPDPTREVVMCSALGQEAKVIESIRWREGLHREAVPAGPLLGAIEKALGSSAHDDDHATLHDPAWFLRAQDPATMRTAMDEAARRSLGGTELVRPGVRPRAPLTSTSRAVRVFSRDELKQSRDGTRLATIRGCASSSATCARASG